MSSMGTIAARKCREIVNNTEAVLAIELLCAAQALDLFTNMKPGEGTLAAYQAIRRTVSHMDADRFLARDIEAGPEAHPFRRDRFVRGRGRGAPAIETAVPAPGPAAARPVPAPEPGARPGGSGRAADSFRCEKR